MRRLGWVLFLIPVIGMLWLGTSVLRRGLVGGAVIRHTSELNADAGLGTRPTSLVGVYGIASGSILKPVLRVDSVKDGYQFSERTEGEWQVDPQVPHTAGEAEVEQALRLKSVTGFPVYGLVTDRAMLLKVPPGWSAPGDSPAGPFMTKTGFILVSGRKLFEAEKVEMGGR